jgi:hypothetical protein
MGAVSTVSFAGLAANRALQLDEPTGGETAIRSVLRYERRTYVALFLVNQIRTPAASCRLVNTVRWLSQTRQCDSDPGGLVPPVNQVLCSSMNLARPVGQADMGAVSTVSFAGLAANRALQLDEPTGGETAIRSVLRYERRTYVASCLVNQIRTPAASRRLVNTVRWLSQTRQCDSAPGGLVRQPPVLGFCGIPILLQTRF